MEEILKEFRALAADKVRGRHSHTAAAPIVYDYKVSKSSEGGGGGKGRGSGGNEGGHIVAGLAIYARSTINKLYCVHSC